MNKRTIIFVFAFLSAFTARVFGQVKDSLPYHEQFRPQIHFSPKAHWMNDPNGLVYFNHTYHLFFQYYPGAMVWGPMHWGHAVSQDMIHWKELPIAIYPDSLGYIFSGSAVVDSNNTSGFGRKGKIPLVAIFTQHDPKGADAGRKDFQNQSIAYSLDGGYTWTKYKDNPVLKNPGTQDFRDPKVSWYKNQKEWIMTLAVGDHIEFYSSRNLKNWKKESEFGKEVGAHGGVWECPDLFPMKLNGKTYWVLIVNINPGGPNKGSATQYFIGQFDGKTFTPEETTTKWLDYGPDEYAGVTWSNTGSRRIFLGWMSNWLYATQVPTSPWRSAFTVPRELGLFSYDNHVYLKSSPVKELNRLQATEKLSDLRFKAGTSIKKTSGQYRLDIKTMASDIKLELSNADGQKLIVGFNKADDQFIIDRTRAGISGFNKDFAGIETSPRLSNDKNMAISLIVDRASVELFADDGKTAMTCIFFSDKPMDRLMLTSATPFTLSYAPLRSIW